MVTGTNLQLNFVRNSWSDRPEDRVPTMEFVNFEQEPGKVSNSDRFARSHLVRNQAIR